MNIRFEVIVPKKLWNTKKLQQVIDNALDGGALLAKTKFDVTSQTWRERPKFLISKKTGERTIYTTDLIYKFVSGGTRVRYATMTQGFRPKTRVRKLVSYKGRGGVAFISRKHPRPGITAREYPDEVIKEINKVFPSIVQRAIDAEV